MFPKLMKLVIKSRFSWSYFLIIFIFSLYGVLSIVLSRLPTGANYSEYYFSGILAVFSLMGIIMGGLTLSRSDSEFLLVSPVRRRALATALYIGQYLYTGPLILIAFLIYSLSTPYPLPVKLAIFGDVALMSTIPVSLSVCSSNLHIVYKIGASAAAVAWAFSFLINFPFSPVAMFNGQLYTGIAATVVVSVLLLFRALTLMSSDSLAFKVLDRGNKRSDYKRIMSYSDKSPMGAIFQYGFSEFEIASRTNFSGTPTLSGRRFRIIYVMLVFIAVAVLYVYAVFHLEPPSPGPGATFDFIPVLFGIYIGVFPPLIMASGTMPMERAWLSFTSMRPSKYMPMLTVVKMVQLACVMAALAVGDVVLYILGVKSAVNTIAIFVLYSPLFLGLFMEINYRVQHYQIKDEKLIVSRYSASQFVLVPLILVFFVVAAVASILPVIDIVAVPVFAAIVAFFLFWRNFWDNRLYSLVEKGFV